MEGDAASAYFLLSLQHEAIYVKYIITLPKASVILFLASFSSKDKAEIYFEQRVSMSPQVYHLTTLDM